MAHDVRRTRCRMPGVNRIGKGRIEIRNTRQNLIAGPAQFLLGLGIGNHGIGIHFRARRCNRQHNSNGKCLFHVHFSQNDIPGIALRFASCRNQLRAVNRGAAADRKNHVDVFLFCRGNAPLGFFQTRIRRNACTLDRFDARSMQCLHNRVKDAEALNAATTRDKQRLVAQGFHALGKVFLHRFSEKNFRGNMKYKVMHKLSPLS